VLYTLDQTSHDTFGILILGSHCVLKKRPRYTLGPSIRIICLAMIQTSHDTCQLVPFRTVRTVPYRYMYRTVRCGTVPFKQRTVNGNICPKRKSSLRCHRLTLQRLKKGTRPASIEKKYRNGALDTLGQIYRGRPSRYSNSDTLGSSFKQKYHVKFGFSSHSYES